MEFKSIYIKSNNQLSTEYRSGADSILSYFHYHPANDYSERLKNLHNRTYKRDKLVSALTHMNEDWGAPKETFKNIKSLQDEQSVVVVGGQQAGLLTGPMYTVNKVISIIKLAKEQEKKLQIPVIPVFWIAGEDHDIDEVNHILSFNKNQLYKHTLPQKQIIKKPLSNTELDHDIVKNWLKEFLNDLPETTHSREWYQKAVASLSKSATYVDFFARLIYQIFPDDGVVLFDSHHKRIRELERDYFNLFLSHQQEITNEIYKTVQHLQNNGYHVALDVEESDANLFLQNEQNERILLKREHGQWIGKNDEIKKSTEEMLKIIQDSPERLSNNVMTRPMMQELLLPTLAFVAGDGEISYWAALKSAFEVLDIKVPPIVPRLSFTYVTERTAKLAHWRMIDLDEVINEGTEGRKQNWLLAQEQVPIDLLFKEAKNSIRKIHSPIEQFAADVSPDLKMEAEKNLVYIEKQVDYLKKRMLSKLNDKYTIPLSQFDELNTALRPNGVLQERILNPFFFINKYGYNFISDIVSNDGLSFQHEHYLIYLK